jgi:hypothetical protein
MKLISWDVGIYNLSYCILEYDKDTKENSKIIDWDIINLVDNEDMKKNRNLLFENIPRKLHERTQLLDVDIVVIENQPSLKNPQMKSIQMILYSYFLILGKVVGNGEKSTSYIDKIDFCSASNKLKIYDGPPIILSKKNKEEETTKIKYSDKKKLAVEYAKYFLEKDETYKEFFNTHKKKDDLADSYLQGLYFISKN